MSFLPNSLCEFFTGDLCMMLSELFSINCRPICCDDDMGSMVDDLSYKIRQNYPDRLITYDAEELNEMRLIRFSDLTPSVIELMLANGCKEEKLDKSKDCDKDDVDKTDCKKSKNPCKKAKSIQNTRKCEKRKSSKDTKLCDGSLEFQNCAKRASTENTKKCEPQSQVQCGKPEQAPDATAPKACINICDSLKPFNTVERLTRRQLAQLDDCSRALHKQQAQSQKDQDAACIPVDWDCLNSMQKFSFYWQALTGHKLRATPFENFKDVFSRRYRKNFPRNNDTELRTAVRYCWRRLKTEERVPYNLHALLYAVSVGEVDACDHAAVRLLLSRWK